MQPASTPMPSLAYRGMLIIGAFFFRYRNAIFPLIFVVMVVCLKPTVQLGSPLLDRLLTTMGVLVSILGVSARLAVIGYAYIRRGGKDGKVYAEGLVTEGLYAHSRNPMYVGNLLITLGIGAIYGSTVMYFLVMPSFIFVYVCIIVCEEAYLLSKFGDEYIQYCKCVPRFFPNLKGLKSTLSGFSYDWKKALRKDYGTLSATLGGIVILLLLKMYHLEGSKSATEHLVFWSMLLIAIFIFYLAIRYLKFSGKLGGPYPREYSDRT